MFIVKLQALIANIKKLIEMNENSLNYKSLNLLTIFWEDLKHEKSLNVKLFKYYFQHNTINFAWNSIKIAAL